MLPINYNKVKLKNLLGIIENPTIEDFLFEIVYFLDVEKNYIGEFKIRDVSLKTRIRLSSDIKDDILKLVNLGYVEKLHYTNFKINHHLWE